MMRLRETKKETKGVDTHVNLGFEAQLLHGALYWAEHS